VILPILSAVSHVNSQTISSQTISSVIKEFKVISLEFTLLFLNGKDINVNTKEVIKI
jgi:hypothetical protein